MVKSRYSRQETVSGDLMKKFFATIPNRWKAVYLVWVFINFILLITGRLFRYDRDFYPFEYQGGKQHLVFDVSVYDYSEFLIYTLTPVVIYFVIKLWNKKDAQDI